MSATVNWTERAGAAVLTFDQPNSRANVLSPTVWRELEAALTDIATQSVSGLILMSLKPDVFIAGADLKFLSESIANDPPAVAAFIQHGQRVLQQLEAMPFPTVAAIDGAALGGGLEVALACDVILMGTNPKVQLGLPEIKLGLIPGWGGTQRLPRLVGAEEALERLLSGESYAANDPPPDDFAKVVDSQVLFVAAVDALDPETAMLRRRLKIDALEPGEMPKKDFLDSLGASLAALEVTMHPAALEVIQVVLQGCALPLTYALALETQAFLRLTQTPEAQQLIKEFFNKRKR